MFYLSRMKKALESNKIRLPNGLTREQKRSYIIATAKDDYYNELIDLWYTNPDINMELHEYLCMSKEEYYDFVNSFWWGGEVK